MATEYQDHEFCEDVDCPFLRTSESCCLHEVGCIHTAKEFHKWLKANWYKIVKKDNDNEI